MSQTHEESEDLFLLSASVDVCPVRWDYCPLSQHIFHLGHVCSPRDVSVWAAYLKSTVTLSLVGLEVACF